MRRGPLFLAALGLLCALTRPAVATILAVPSDYPNIQEAVAAAAPGDTIAVGSGRWCGAVIDKPLRIEARGLATIIGCPQSPAPLARHDTRSLLLRAGFWLSPNDDGAASGTSIRGFQFDGDGISNHNLTPLAFGVYARKTDNVTLTGNGFHGSVQPITNSSGSGWIIARNHITGFTAFDCDGWFCGGGVGIVIEHQTAGDPAAHDNLVMHNTISGVATALSGPDAVLTTGIAVISAEDGVVIKDNHIAVVPESRSAFGSGVTVASRCCDESDNTPMPTNLAIVDNNFRGSAVGIVTLYVPGHIPVRSAVTHGNSGACTTQELDAVDASGTSAGSPNFGAPVLRPLLGL